MDCIEKNKVVSLRYRIADSQGSIIIDHMGEKPIEYIQGIGVIHPALELPLYGLYEGSCKKFEFTDEKLGGTVLVNVMIAGVRDATESELKNGTLIQVVQKECGPDCDCG